MKQNICLAFMSLVLLSTEGFSSANHKETEGEQLELTRVTTCFNQQGYTLEQRQTITKLFSSSKKRAIPPINAPEGRDFGYNFPRLTLLDTTLFLAINAFQETRSPICYDLGAGYGESSCYMVLAGGKVTYIDHHPDVAKTAHQEVYKALKGVAGSNAKLKKALWGRLRMVKANFLEIDNEKLYPKGLQIDFCNLSNVLHFLTPKQMDTFLPALLKKMAPASMVFASFHAPRKSTKVADYFLKQKKEGNPYPGYFRYKRHCIPDPDRSILGTVLFKEIEELNDAEPAQEGDLPGQDIGQKSVNAPSSLAYKAFIELTTVIHYFDPDVARAAFERAGFTVYQSIFTDRFGIPVEDQKVTREALITGNYHVSLIAAKEK